MEEKFEGNDNWEAEEISGMEGPVELEKNVENIEGKKTSKKERLSMPYKSRLRNLKQYRDLSDDEFQKKVTQGKITIESDNKWEEKIKAKLEEFSNDYSLDDLRVNDLMTLRSLASAVLRLEDFEARMNRITNQEGVTDDNILVLDKLGKLMSDLRNDISKMQDDLKITRKNRKGDKEQSVINYLEDLKKKAKQFYEEKAFQVFCPKCNMLLATLWTLYPEGKNKLVLTCDRTLDSGEKCGEIISISTQELVELGGNNKKDIPETLK